MSPRKQRRREEAEERQAERDSRSDSAQLKDLTIRGHAHCKEARQLAAKLNELEKGK